MIFEVIKLGFFYGCFIGLVALGFALIYSILHIVDFAHTDRMVVSGYIFLTLLTYFNQIIAGLLAVISAVVLSVITEYFIYRKVRKSNSRLLLLTSLGLSIVIQNVLAIVYSDNLKEYPFFEHTVLNTKLYVRELILLPLLIVICLLLYYWLKNSKNGISIRACISNFEKALTIGIPFNKLYILIFIISGVIAGFGGIYLSMGFGLTPYSGFKIMILAFSSCLIAGLDNIYGAVIIGIFSGLLLSVFEYFTNSLFAESLTLLILFSVLLVFPKGIFGKTLRII
jgi:branched-chain amino acid transport system permease protein